MAWTGPVARPADGAERPRGTDLRRALQDRAEAVLHTGRSNASTPRDMARPQGCRSRRPRVGPLHLPRADAGPGSHAHVSGALRGLPAPPPGCLQGGRTGVAGSSACLRGPGDPRALHTAPGRRGRERPALWASDFLRPDFSFLSVLSSSIHVPISSAVSILMRQDTLTEYQAGCCILGIHEGRKT